ncbi:MAG TPA: serine hydrolase domain-containing protein, partial [Anaerolineae bacterium]|nr:serine hydrolase domain-containing protein [Anaerolineae bacterium]
MLSPANRAWQWLGLALLALVLASCIRPRPAPGSQANPGATAVATPAPNAEAIANPPAAVVELAEADAYLAAETAAGHFSGAVLVARQGRILLRKGYGLADRERGLPNTPQTRFHIASLTKQFTAMAVMQLQERGTLQVTDRVARFLPDSPP